MASMKEIAAGNARNRPGLLPDAARSAPVRVTRKGKTVGVMTSLQNYRTASWRCPGAACGGDGRKHPGMG